MGGEVLRHVDGSAAEQVKEYVGSVMLVFDPKVQAMLACGPIEGIAKLVAGEPGALRDAVVGSVLKIWEPDLIA